MPQAYFICHHILSISIFFSLLCCSTSTNASRIESFVLFALISFHRNAFVSVCVWMNDGEGRTDKWSNADHKYIKWPHWHVYANRRYAFRFQIQSGAGCGRQPPIRTYNVQRMSAKTNDSRTSTQSEESQFDILTRMLINCHNSDTCYLHKLTATEKRITWNASNRNGLNGISLHVYTHSTAHTSLRFFFKCFICPPSVWCVQIDLISFLSSPPSLHPRPEIIIYYDLAIAKALTISA